MLRALHPRHRRSDVALILEKVETAPALSREIMRRTQRAALRTRAAGATLARHLQVQLMRLGRGVPVLIHQPS